MAKFQHKLRWLIVAGSTVGFLGSWGLLAHAGKPASNSLTVPDPMSVQSVPQQLPPIDFKSLESAQGAGSLQPLPALPAMPAFRAPRLRSGGS
jgi:hypothetical protein